jgi:hypothetical protein
MDLCGFFVMHVRRIIPVADGKRYRSSIAETKQNSVISNWKKDFIICNFVTHTSIRHSCVLFYLEVPAGTCLKLEKCSDIFGIPL